MPYIHRPLFFHYYRTSEDEEEEGSAKRPASVIEGGVGLRQQPPLLRHNSSITKGGERERGPHPGRADRRRRSRRPPSWRPPLPRLASLQDPRPPPLSQAASSPGSTLAFPLLSLFSPLTTTLPNWIRGGTIVLAYLLLASHRMRITGHDFLVCRGRIFFFL